MWLDGFEHIKVSDGSPWANDVADKLVLHTTEGGWESAMAVFRRGSAPHFLVDPATQRKAQLVSLDRAAMALWNEPGGIETNRAGCVVQVEIVGYAALTGEYPDTWYRWLAKEVIRPICLAKGIPPRSTLFYGANRGYVLATIAWVGRMNGDEWNNYSGILGHQHVGENDHWDPGALDTAKVLAYSFGGGEIYNPITDVSHFFGFPSVDFALQQEHPDMASADEIMAKLNEIQTFLGHGFGGGVEVFPGDDGVWRTAALVNGKPTHPGGAVVPQLLACAYEAASATRRQQQVLSVDYDQLADAIFRRLTKG